MAIHRYVGGADAIAAAAATTRKTLLELGAPATRKLGIRRWWIETDGVSSVEKPVLVEVFTCTGSATLGTTLTVANLKKDNGLPDPLAVLKHTATNEGTPGTEKQKSLHRVSPNSFRYEHEYPLGEELIVAVSEFWRLAATVPSGGAAVNYAVGVEWEE